MKRPKLKDYTFTEGLNLFQENVLMVFSNKDKEHIVSIGEHHRQKMIANGYNPENNQDVLQYLQLITKLI